MQFPPFRVWNLKERNLGKLRNRPKPEPNGTGLQVVLWYTASALGPQPCREPWRPWRLHFQASRQRRERSFLVIEADSKTGNTISTWLTFMRNELLRWASRPVAQNRCWEITSMKFPGGESWSLHFITTFQQIPEIKASRPFLDLQSCWARIRLRQIWWAGSALWVSGPPRSSSPFIVPNCQVDNLVALARWVECRCGALFGLQLFFLNGSCFSFFFWNKICRLEREELGLWFEILNFCKKILDHKLNPDFMLFDWGWDS